MLDRHNTTYAECCAKKEGDPIWHTFVLGYSFSKPAPSWPSCEAESVLHHRHPPLPHSAVRPPSLLCPSSFHLPSPPLHVFVHHLSIMCAGGEEALGEGGESGEREGSKIPHKKGNMSRNRRTRRKRKEEEGIALYQPKGKKKRGRRRKEPSSPMAFFNERRYPPPPHLSSLSHFMTFYCLLPSPSPSLCPDTSD